MKFRTQRGDVIQTYKILNRIDRLDPEILFAKSPYAATRGHCEKLYMQHSRTELRRRFYSFRVVRAWSSLPKWAIEASPVDAFKNAVDKIYGQQKYHSVVSTTSHAAHTIQKKNTDRGSTGNV